MSECHLGSLMKGGCCLAHLVELKRRHDGRSHIADAEHMLLFQVKAFRLMRSLETPNITFSGPAASSRLMLETRRTIDKGWGSGLGGDGDDTTDGDVCGINMGEKIAPMTAVIVYSGHADEQQQPRQHFQRLCSVATREEKAAEVNSRPPPAPSTSPPCAPAGSTTTTTDAAAAVAAAAARSRRISRREDLHGFAANSHSGVLVLPSRTSGLTGNRESSCPGLYCNDRGWGVEGREEVWQQQRQKGSTGMMPPARQASENSRRDYHGCQVEEEPAGEGRAGAMGGNGTGESANDGGVSALSRPGEEEQMTVVEENYPMFQLPLKVR